MTTFILTVLLLLMQPTTVLNQEPATTCAPPPRYTVEVPCAPDEGCSEKWIFVEREAGGNT